MLKHKVYAYLQNCQSLVTISKKAGSLGSKPFKSRLENRALYKSKNSNRWVGGHKTSECLLGKIGVEERSNVGWQSLFEIRTRVSEPVSWLLSRHAVLVAKHCLLTDSILLLHYFVDTTWEVEFICESSPGNGTTYLYLGISMRCR